MGGNVVHAPVVSFTREVVNVLLVILDEIVVAALVVVNVADTVVSVGLAGDFVVSSFLDSGYTKSLWLFLSIPALIKFLL